MPHNFKRKPPRTTPRHGARRTPAVSPRRPRPVGGHDWGLAALLTAPYFVTVGVLAGVHTVGAPHIEIARILPIDQQTLVRPIDAPSPLPVTEPALDGFNVKAAPWVPVGIARTPASPSLAQEIETASDYTCRADHDEAATSGQSQTDDEISFGMKLAAAARAQTHEFVVYNDAYQSISYPMGDVSFLFGVCTDVVIRAYRTLDIDLQKLVFESGLGQRDRNIDHRRTAVLKSFFARYGETLPVSDRADDYQAGDIVTFYRPNNRGIRAHIAIVSDERGPSGAPMIVHNQGNGPELDDALFADPITGHFRYSEKVISVATKSQNRELRNHAH